MKPRAVHVDGEPDRPLRVVVLVHTAQEGGAELALLRLLASLDRQRTHVTVALFAEGPLVERLRSAHVETNVIPFGKAGIGTDRRAGLVETLRGAFSLAGSLPRVVRALRSADADLIVANSLKAALVAQVVAPLAGKRWVWHLHDRLASDYLPAKKVALLRRISDNGPRTIVVNSRATLATLRDKARSKAVLAYPGLTAMAPAGSLYTPAGEAPTVGIIGRISPTKGQHEFVRAVSALIGEFPDLRLLIVGAPLFGEEKYFEELQQLIEQFGVADRVTLTGWLPDPSEELRKLSVLVHASPAPEPFGQVVAEALASMVPVVATAAGGVPEILGGHEFQRGWVVTERGVLVGPGDVSALSDAVKFLLTDPEGNERRAVAGLSFVRANMSIESTASAIEAAWHRAVSPVRVKHTLD